MIAKLVSADPWPTTYKIPLSRLPLTIGRGDEADAPITDQWASPLHCRIVQSQGRLVVRDLGSTFGTLVNRQPITEIPLNHGDTLTVGISTFRVHLGFENVHFGIRLWSSIVQRIGASVKKLHVRQWSDGVKS